MTIPDDHLPADDLAPTIVEELLPENPEELPEEDKEGEEEEGGEGGDKKGGTGGKKPGVHVKLSEELPEEDLSAYDSEKLIDKLKMLVWAPFSGMVPGASSFEAETDLKRKLFLGQVGLMTKQIELHDIADPDLIAKLEARNQQRQEIMKAEMIASAAGNASGLAAGLILDTPPPEQVQKREMKQQISQPKEPSLDARLEVSSQEKQDGGQRVQKVEQPVAFKTEAETQDYAQKEQDQGDFARTEIKQNTGMDLDDILDVLDVTNSADDPSYDSPPVQPGGLAAAEPISTAFNASAQKTEYSAPEQKIELKFADPAPKMETTGLG